MLREQPTGIAFATDLLDGRNAATRLRPGFICPFHPQHRLTNVRISVLVAPRLHRLRPLDQFDQLSTQAKHLKP